MVGCACAGLMGCAADGVPLEHDPTDNKSGVSLLLGRMPGATLRPFCDLPVGRASVCAACASARAAQRVACTHPHVVKSRHGCLATLLYVGASRMHPAACLHCACVRACEHDNERTVCVHVLRPADGPCAHPRR